MSYYFISYQKVEGDEDHHKYIQNVVTDIHPMLWLQEQFDRISYRDEDVRIISYNEIDRQYYDLLKGNLY